jgi:hypothetical protein
LRQIGLLEKEARHVGKDITYTPSYEEADSMNDIPPLIMPMRRVRNNSTQTSPNALNLKHLKLLNKDLAVSHVLSNYSAMIQRVNP